MTGIGLNNIRNVDLNLLVAFNTLYEMRNVTRAAERLALTQPTVSGMLSRLRDLFDDPLFVRTQYGITPTPRADALAAPVNKVLADVEALVTPSDFDPKSLKMTISVSANDYMQHALIVPFIKKLRRRAPGIKVSVMPAYIADLSERLARGVIDLAVTIPEFSDPGLPSLFLYTERYICIARRNHPLGDAQLSLDAFCKFDHVLVSPTGGSFTGPTDEALAERGLRRAVSVSVPSFHVMLELVRTNDFLALAPERLLRGKMAGLRRFTPPVDVPSFDVTACWNTRLDKDPVQRWIRGVLASEAKGAPS